MKVQNFINLLINNSKVDIDFVFIIYPWLVLQNLLFECQDR